MDLHKFVRKPMYVNAVRVTQENLLEVARWCGGTSVGPPNEPVFIKVIDNRSRTVPRSKAFVGDWVLESLNGYRVYTNVAFHKSFEKMPEVEGEWPDTHEAAIKLMSDYDKGKDA